MSIATRTPAQEAFVALADHCILNRCCKVDLTCPQRTQQDCETAQALYRAWFGLWRAEVAAR